MHKYALRHLSDAALMRRLATLVAQDCATTASLLAHIAEVDARRLYLPAGYPSMHAYCVEALHLSEDASFKRIQAARAARQFPLLLQAMADGRLHLSAVCLLAPHLTRENARGLVAAATHRRKAEVERFLADRFPRPSAWAPPASVSLLPAIPLAAPLAPGQVGLMAGPADAAGAPGVPTAPGEPAARSGSTAPGAADTSRTAPAELAPGQVDEPTAGRAGGPAFVLRVAITGATLEKLRYAQALLGHAVPAGDVAQVLDRALDALIRQAERRKFAATSRVQSEPAARAKVTARRSVPAHVRRAVWKRDQGRCAFVGKHGRRCAARASLEFDHVDPVARGGEALVERMRLLCRGHNQYEAERVFGAGFMRGKREEARARVQAKAQEQALAVAEAEARKCRQQQARRETLAKAGERDPDVAAALRQLGVRGREARHAAALSQSGLNSTLEERIRRALSLIGQTGTARTAPALRASTVSPALAPA